MNGRSTEPPEETGTAPRSDAAVATPLTRRRLAVIVAGLVGLWLVGVFAKQVGDAASAASQADQMRARNVAMERDIASLEAELALIQQPAFVAEMARGYLLGSSIEVPFAIDPNALPLPSDAPGSVGIQPSTATQPSSPLDSWLQALFGSQT
jgi:cell division protein FtsB